MGKIKILFFIFDLGGGGAENVLANLVNVLNPEKYDITVKTLFGKGVNTSKLPLYVKHETFFKRKPFRGITHLLKLFSPTFLYKRIIGKEKYDIVIAYLENSTTRIISGCPYEKSRKYAWLHIQNVSFIAFRNKREAISLYSKFDDIAAVSETVKEHFERLTDGRFTPKVVYNTLQIDRIKEIAAEEIPINLSDEVINLCTVGRLTAQKNYMRLLNSVRHLKEIGIKNFHLYILGKGEQREMLESFCEKAGLNEMVTFLGFQKNPHKFVSKMDLFVCSSDNEGYSTAVTESIILGVPVLTTNCSGMSEIIGDSNAGIIVENSDIALTEGLSVLLQNPAKISEMKDAATERSEFFSTERTVAQFESFIGTV